MPSTTKRARESAEYRTKYPERESAAQSRYYQAHKAERLQKQAARRPRIKAKMKAYMAAWYQKKKEELRPVRAAYWTPERIAYFHHKRRARKAAAPVNDLTAAQWKTIKAVYRHRCAYCGCKPKVLTQDHLTPIVHGGSHTLSNVVPACGPCNSKKGKGAVLKPVQPLLL